MLTEWIVDDAMAGWQGGVPGSSLRKLEGVSGFVSPSPRLPLWLPPGRNSQAASRAPSKSL